MGSSNSFPPLLLRANGLWLSEDLASLWQGRVRGPGIPFVQHMSTVFRASRQCLVSISSRPDGQEATWGICRDTKGTCEWNFVEWNVSGG